MTKLRSPDQDLNLKPSRLQRGKPNRKGKQHRQDRDMDEVLANRRLKEMRHRLAEDEATSWED